MQLQSLTPATQAVLNALAELGQGNIVELAEKSGKARSTIDRALRILAEAGLIVEVDLGADAAEGTPARWALSEQATAALDSADLSDQNGAGSDEADDELPSDPDDETSADESPTSETSGPGDQEPGDGEDASDQADTGAGDQDEDGSPTPAQNGSDATANDEPRTAVVAPARPADRRVMAIKGVLAESGEDGASVKVIVAETGISEATTIRLLAAMEQADAARRLPPKTGLPQRWIAGPTKASEVDPNPEPPRCALCFQVIRGVTSTPAAVAAVQSLIRPDGTLQILAADDEVHVVKLPTRLPPRTLNNTPNTGAYRNAAAANGDGNQPFAKGQLEKLTVAELAANPGRPMNPQEIAAAISAKLNGRNVSSGAIRNNCTKAAAAGTIRMISEAPLTFVFPAPAVPDSTPEKAPAADGSGTGRSVADDADEQETTAADES
ncbi:helix-turn-helix domain-containing protein [Actinoplanes sp. NPDC020271]|uniref:helix-turn-helix domain-containing protein n=1 Tax=Actinoplanes sp. NPDC020271 TaxID=3363896 RepID=UPI0037BE20AD